MPVRPPLTTNENTGPATFQLKLDVVPLGCPDPMIGQFLEQWIDRHLLDVMGGVPLEPLVTDVFGQLDIDGANELGQENDQLFLSRNVTMAFCVDDILVFEFEIRIDIDILGSNSGFLFKFSKGTFKIRFTGIDMAFGQIPSIEMSHQQEGCIRIILDDQETTRFYFAHCNASFSSVRNSVLNHGAPMKIYTKTGDKGETGLLAGVRVSKSHLAIKVCGALDETNSWLGFARTESLLPFVDEMLTQVQHDLFEIGCRVAGCMGESQHRATDCGIRTGALEQWIDRAEAELPPLAVFILPSGSCGGCTIHLARSVCRRAEREMVELIQSGVGSDLSAELTYLNRLGDLLFVMARLINQDQGAVETEWIADS